MRIFVILCLFIYSFSFAQLKLEDLRVNFKEAISSEKTCKYYIDLLEKHKTDNSTYLAYFGAFQTIYANHVYNPINKLKYFNKGKENIEKAILLNQNDVDIRFIRYSIQKNCPKILGYRKNLIEDEKFLIENFNSISSDILKQMITNLLKL
jgi:hypothetical protein